MAAFVSEYRGELAESYRMSGAPGTWASDLDAAPRVLSEQGVQAFVLRLRTAYRVGCSQGVLSWFRRKPLTDVRGSVAFSVTEPRR